MTEVQAYLYIALFFTMAAYVFYWFGMRKKLVRPNRFSWLIWGAVMTVEALTYQAVNQGMVQNLVFFMSAASCLFITFAIWRDGTWEKPSQAELISMGFALAALVVWLGFQSERWAHVLIVLAVPISFIPTWMSAREDKRREMSPAWSLWTIGDFATMMLIIRSGVTDPLELPYIVVEFLCHASVWALIGWQSANPMRGLKEAEVQADPRYFCGNPADSFAIVTNGKGQGVVSTRPFAVGTALMEFTGPRYHRSEILANRSGAQDRFLQIDAERYLGPSGNLDDLVNHSCDPNAGLRFDGERILLVAVKPIQAGDELAWDYSTTSSSTHFSMRCACGASDCRNVVGDFEFLDPELQERYRAMQLVPPYLRRPAHSAPEASPLAA